MTLDICRCFYGYKFNDKQLFHTKQIEGKSRVLDYCLTNDIGAFNKENHNRILAGERYFLYKCFYRIYNENIKNDIAGDKQKLFLWRYLTIKSEFRAELIQVNGNLGFDNFSRYQNRKTLFIKNNYLNSELLKLAIGSTCIDQNINSIEGRIMCNDSFKKTRKELNLINKDYLKESIEVFLVIHFSKLKSKKNCTPKNLQCRIATKKTANRLYRILDGEQKLLYKDNTRIRIKGIDACSNEIGCRPEVFAQTYRFLLNEAKTTKRESISDELSYCEDDGKLKATYHVGEDFLDISDGLRAIDEVLLFCGYSREFRIGHALALGINANEYYRSKNYKIILPKQDALDNVVWMIERSIEFGIEMCTTLKGELLHLFSKWVSDIYENKVNIVIPHQEIIACEYFNAWKLRGDNPDIYKKTGEEFIQYLNIEEIDRFKRYNINDAVDNAIRRKHRHRNLYFRYHFDESVQIHGNEIVTMTINQSYIDHITKLQNAMIHLLVTKGIGIECNPSSNFLIGTIDKYYNHPILRFQPLKQESSYPGKLSASIYTDDQGVFDTYLENEYAMMACSLQKEYEKGSDLIYDIEDVYSWIDNIRKLGIQQKF